MPTDNSARPTTRSPVTAPPLKATRIAAERDWLAAWAVRVFAKTAIRIPMFHTNPKLKRLEFRPPDPSCNPYLAFSAMILAGLDGIQNRIHPGEPLDKDIYDLSPEELKDVPSLPGSLDESLKALEADHEFLLKGDVFSPQLIERWIRYKREKEIDALRLRPHPLEFALYFDV